MRSSSSSPEELCFAASYKFRECGNKDAARVLTDLSQSPESKGSQYKESYDGENECLDTSALEAVRWLLINDISKSTYEDTRTNLHRKMPPYKVMVQAKKKMLSWRNQSFWSLC